MKTKNLFAITTATISTSAAILLAAFAAHGQSKTPPLYPHIIDSRDGQNYRIVQMSDGKTWMAQNLNSQTKDSWCYDNNDGNCKQYGRLYTWEAAKNACASLGDGWRLPDDDDWDALLVGAVGGMATAGQKLKAAWGWKNDGNGADEFGFGALPGGYRTHLGQYDYIGEMGFWWSATTSVTGYAYYRNMRYNGDYAYKGSVPSGNKGRGELGAGHSARCVKGERKPFVPNVVETVPEGAGTFTDTRNKKTYRTVKIGDQTWMAENLNYQTGTSWCYENKSANCDKYGRLYDWDAAMKACPAGFRLPADGDFNALATALGGKKAAGTKLKSKTGWVRPSYLHPSMEIFLGTDEVGFSALPGGQRISGGYYNHHVGYSGVWWSASLNGTNSWALRSDMEELISTESDNRAHGNSVRCLKD